MNEYIVDGQVYQVSNELLESFLKKYPNAQLSKKTEPVKTTPVVPDAVAGEEIASDTALPSDPGFLDLVGPSETPEVDTSFVSFESPEAAKTAEEEIQLEQQAQNESARQAINQFLLDKGIQPELAGKDEGKLTEITAFEETQRISKSDIQARKKRQEEFIKLTKDPSGLTKLKSLQNSAGNFLLDLQAFDDQAKYLKAWLELEVANTITDLSGEEWKPSKDAEKRLGEANAEIERLNSLRGKTIGFEELKERGDYLTGGIVATLDAVSSFASSAAVAAPTAGLGLGVQMISGGIKDYNDQKAESQGITTDQLLQTGQGETLIPAFIGSIGYKLEKIGLKGVQKYINAQSIGFKKGLYGFLSSGTKEGVTEWVQGGLSKLNELIAKKEDVSNIGSKVFSYMVSSDGRENLWKGMAGGGVSGAGARNIKAAIGIRNNTENENIKNKVQQITELESSKYQKNLSDTDVARINDAQNQLRADLIVGFKKNEKLINVLNQSEINEVNKNFNIVQNSEAQIQETINSNKYTQETKNLIINNLRKDINKANQEIYNIRNTAEKIAQSTETIKEKATEIKGVQVKDFETTKEVEDFVKQQNPDQDTTKASEQQGFIVQNPNTGEQTIVINKEVAKQEKAVNVAAHEFLHAILYKTVKDSPETSVNLGNALLNELDKIDASQIKDSKFKKRMEQYADQSKDVQMEEALTLFSDAIATGDIKFSENVFTKMGDVIRRSLQKLGVNIKFNNGRDVYNFVKDYNASIAKGDLSLAQVKAAARGVEGKLVTPKQQEKEIETIIKESKSDSDAVQTIFEQKGKEGAFEIIEKFKPITNRIVQRRSEAPGFDRQLLTDEIETGKRGIIDLINEYDASKGVPLAAYINKFLPARAIEASNRVLDTEFKLDVTEARGVTDTTTEEVTEQVAEKPTKAKESLRKKIKLDKATTQKVVDAVTKTFGTKLPPVDSPQFKKALQKGFRTELKITIAKDVLGSRAAYETFLRDNFENIYEAIPQEIINKRFRPFAEDTGKREKTKEGKKIFKKKDITKAEFINYFLGRDVGTSTKGTRKDALAEALAEEFAFDATMETIQKPEVVEKREFVDKTQTTEKVSEAIKRPIDLKFSKSQKQVEINEEPIKVLQALEKYERNRSSMNKEELDLVEDFIAKAAIAEADKGKGAQQYTKAIKNSELNEDLKKGNWTLSDAKFKENKKAIKEFNDQAQDLSSQVPILNNVKDKYQKVILGLFAGHYNIVGSEMAKVGSSFKRGIINNLNTKTKSVLSKETLDRWKSFKWENLETSYASKFKTALNKIYKSNNLKEQIKIARETFNNKQGKASLELYDLWNTTMQEWLYSSGQGSKDFNSKADYILKLKKANAAIGTSGERILAPAGYVFLPGVVKEGTIKFEHLKSSSQQSFESAVLVLQGNWKKQGKQNLKAYNGIWGFLNDFNIIDDATGKVNDSNIFRFAENLELAKNIYSIKSDFTKTLYEDIVSKVGKKSVKEFEKNQKDINTFNKNILPKNIKYSKPETNQNVLNDMERLDTEAQDARIKFSKSKNLNKDFNDIIERATGIGAKKQYGQTKARAVGTDKGKFNLLGIPPSAQDFVGLTRYFAGKGKQGDETIAWVKENFLDPFARANIDISNARVALANDFKALKKLLNVSPKDLNKKITGEPYTVGNAVRVYTWIQQGMTIPGLSKADQKILEDYVAADENLVTFANELIAINKDNGYPKPTDGWLAGTITTDLLSGLNTVVRAKYLKQWQNNVDEVFSETNMNKLEAAYGKGYRDALENMLGRMKTGSNRGFKGDTLTGRFIDWINNSVGAIMFFNMRSAVLQTISAVNFVNWSDNNPLKASAAFANQPQYWKDVMKLMNSDYLVERRNGLKINVSEADIAEIAAESKNKAKAFISKILKLGFLPTQIADSFAIASGGATFYRNRYKSLKKEGLSDKEAEAQAFQDFREIAEESQQSSRPDRISQQQAGPMGRIILAFANTPAQYARLMQKAASDLKNRRGDDKTNISKILYYGAIQNVIFNALQQALFAMAFGDEEPDEEKLNKKYTGIANGMADSLLRGVGFHGAAISTLKNVVMKLAEGKEAQDAAIELLDISPPISSKIGKLKSAGRTWDWNKKEIMEKGWSLDNPAYLAAGQVISAATNVPLDRGIRKLQNLKDASDAENEEWMRVANALGWAKWELEWAKNNEVAFTGKRKIERSKLKSNKRKVKRN